MSEWTVIQPMSHRPVDDGAESVRITGTGIIKLSAAVVQRLGEPGSVQFLRNGTTETLGVQAARGPRAAYKLQSYGERGSRSATAKNILKHLNRRPARWGHALHHHWDGGVLVLDVSGLPLREPES